MQKNALAVMAVIAIMSSIGSALWPFPNFGITDSGTYEQITIGKMPLMVHALIYIAEDQDYFAANGLNVTIKDYSAGPASIKGLLSGEVDFRDYIYTEGLEKVKPEPVNIW